MRNHIVSILQELGLVEKAIDSTFPKFNQGIIQNQIDILSFQLLSYAQDVKNQIPTFAPTSIMVFLSPPPAPFSPGTRYFYSLPL